MNTRVATIVVMTIAGLAVAFAVVSGARHQLHFSGAAKVRASVPYIGASYRPAALEEARATATHYLAARDAGDARAACAQMTAGQRYEMVARVTGDFDHARAGDCTRYVLRTSPRSTAVRPELVMFQGRPVEVRRGLAGTILAYPRGFPHIYMELMYNAGRWRIDGQASEKSSFLYACTRQAGQRAAGTCVCTFERLRHWNVSLYGSSRPAAAELRLVVQRAGQLCASGAAS